MQTTGRGQNSKLLKSITHYFFLLLQYSFVLGMASLISFCLGTLVFGYVFENAGTVLPVTFLIIALVAIIVYSEYKLSFWEYLKVISGMAEGDIKAAKRSLAKRNLILIGIVTFLFVATNIVGLLLMNNLLLDLKKGGLPVSYKDLYKGLRSGHNAGPEINKMAESRSGKFIYDSRWFGTDGLPDTLLINKWTTGQRKKAKMLIVGNKDLNVYKDIITKSDYYGSINYNVVTLTPLDMPTPPFGSMLENSTQLELEAKIHILEGDIDGALANQRLIVKSARLFSGEETMLSSMMTFGFIKSSARILYAAINYSKSDDKVMRAYDVYKEFLDKEYINNAFKAELVYSIEFYKKLLKPDLGGFMLQTCFDYPNSIVSIKYFRELILKKQGTSYGNNLSSWPFFFVQIGLNNYKKLYLRQAEARFLVRGVKVLKYAKDYYVKKGIYPLGPEDLIKTGLVKEELIDPLSSKGEMIKFKLTEEGLDIYSVGMDGKDDGGDLGNKYGSSGNDVGFILWYK